MATKRKRPPDHARPPIPPAIVTMVEREVEQALRSALTLEGLVGAFYREHKHTTLRNAAVELTKAAHDVFRIVKW